MPADLSDESQYDRARLRQWARGCARSAGVDRRDLLRLFAAGAAAGAVGLGAAAPAAAAGAAAGAAAAPGTVKPLPPELFTLRGTNAETNFAALRGTGPLTPVDRFFVRNHTVTPRIAADGWRLRVWGDALAGGPVEFSYDRLRSFPAVERTLFIECAGNGRSFYTTQQGQQVSGTAWTLGAIGVARWRGVRLSDVLRRAGVTRQAVDVLPRGLDDEVVTNGVNLGRVRRPLPASKALDDVILAYEMNGEPLPPDHGGPVRVVVPDWIGISSVKWVGDIEVSGQPLYTPWNTDLYRLFGPDQPAQGSAPLTRQTLKSAFELELGATVPVHRTRLLTGRSWSGAAPVHRVEVSTDGGARWQRARLHDAPRRGSWVRWSVPWTPRTPGTTALLARATDATGRTQPQTTAHNTQGYLFDAVVRHPVTVV
ncbi:Sulfoxide reductase catalytic subunit YedY [Streptomyces xanthophaeus]|uniref:sulfite oxidase n=1 Tax=Streptomyces xanthophaeus TaxID=67385 RepID=UPI00233F6219|nr:sulfite oxidase [Streptomyces xanthophaeus]WCD90426.1 Sulfoxide reductase catalytic subunit YedY [Streptomyces xanthophaeus]